MSLPPFISFGPRQNREKGFLGGLGALGEKYLLGPLGGTALPQNIQVTLVYPVFAWKFW